MFEKYNLAISILKRRRKSIYTLEIRKVTQFNQAG